MLHEDGFGHLCPDLATILEEILGDEEYSPEIVGGWYPGKLRVHRYFRNKVHRHIRKCKLCLKKMQKRILKKNSKDRTLSETARVKMINFLITPCQCADCKKGTTDYYRKEYT